MTKIFKNMAPYWYMIVAIVLLLIVQAFGDLSLPQYTSDIIDVGIQNKGVEHILPVKMTEDEYEISQLYMTSKEKKIWKDTYEKKGEYYICKAEDEEKLDQLDDTFLTAIFLNHNMSNVKESQFKKMIKNSIASNPAMAPMKDKIDDMSVDEIGKMLNMKFKSFQEEDDVNSGQILLDNHDVRDYNRRDLRKAFGMVLQDTWLYKGTIMENIRYGRLDATDEEVIEAAKAAHADSFIRTLPGGYNMELNEDASNVSQGQKQLLTIARAILADSKVMILDEATSSVDTRTEALIQKAMDNLMEGRTSFVIAHRLSTIKNADVILVMKDGDIIEQGNHEELLAKGGFYAQLYNSQFEEAA